VRSAFAALILSPLIWGCAPEATAEKKQASGESAAAPVEALAPSAPITAKADASKEAAVASKPVPDPSKPAAPPKAPDPANPAEPAKPSAPKPAKAAPSSSGALAVKMSKGQTLKYKVEMDQVMEPSEGPKQSMAFSMTQVYTVKRAGGNEAELEQKISDYQIAEKTDEPMRQSISRFLDGMKGKPVAVVVKANGEMKGRGAGGSLTSLPGGGGFMGLVLPKKPLAAGLTWSHSQDLSSAGQQGVEMKNAALKTNFTVRSIDPAKGTALIAFKTTGSPETNSTMKMPAQEGQEAREIKITSRTQISAEGTMTVRIKDFVVVGQNLKTTMSVDQTMDGRSQKMTMRQTQKSSLLSSALS
jgi:hypothetical protein